MTRKEDIKKSRQVRINWVIVGLMLAAITALSFPSYQQFDLSPLTVGEESPRTYRVDQKHRVYDRYRTNQEIDQRLRQIKPTFVRDSSIRQSIRKSVDDHVGELRSDTASGPTTDEEWSRFRNITLRIVEFLVDRGIVEDKSPFERFDRQSKLRLRYESEDGTIATEILSIEEYRENVIALGDVEPRARAIVSNIYREYSYSSSVIDVVKSSVRPNVFFRSEDFERAVKTIKQDQEPYYQTFTAGDIVLATGEEVSQRHLALLKEINREEVEFQLTHGLASLGIALIGLVFVYLYLRQFEPSVLRSSNKLGLICLLAVVLTAMTKFVDLLSVELPSHVEFVIPFAAPIMIVSIMVGPELAFVLSIFLGLLTVSFFHFTFELFAMFLVGAFVGILSIIRVERRSTLIQSGLILGGVQVLTVALFYVLRTGDLVTTELGMMLLWAGLNGVVFVPPLVIGLLPFLENIFDITTNFKLLELADLNHPLLRDMFERAPGSFQHSIMLSNLCERAARNIGANALLVRVGAYYHDLGKAEISEYFIENQGDENNPHDELKPTLSASILKSHVKKGAERAREAGLPEEIIDLIEQHHGTTTMQFFYHKALEEGDDSVSEEEFQYPGPRPQTREAGICMLGDAVEATSRTLEDPTPNSVREMVEKIVYDKFKAGQLNECDLTLKDLDVIVRTFTRVITSVHHERIEYPDEVETQDLEEMRDMDLKDYDEVLDENGEGDDHLQH